MASGFLCETIMTNILLIDLSSIAHPLFHVSASDPNPNATSIKTVERVRALATGQPYVAVCCDSGRSFRRDISDDYKANRPPSDATLQHQITLAIETLTDDGFPVWSVKGFEADDLIATAANLAERANGMGPIPLPGMTGNPDDYPLRVVIASADKDLLQLVTDNVVVKSLRDGSILDEDAVFAKLGVKPHQVRDYLALVGDASDNIKGAPGIGEKTAAALLGAFGNLEDLYAALDKGDARMKPGTVKALTEFRPRMDTVRSLIALRTDVPIPFEDIFKERTPKDVAVFEGTHTTATLLDEVGSVPNGFGGLPYGDRNMGSDRSGGAERTDPVQPGHGSAGGPADERRSVDHGGTRVGGNEPPASDRVDGANQPKPAPAADPSAERPAQGLAVREAEVMPAPSAEFHRQLEPRTLRESALLAAEMFKSKLFSQYGTYQGVLATILAGRELGMQSMASLRGFHIIDGRPTLSADLIRALCLKSDACEYFRCTERTNEKATWQTKRKGEEPQALTFTIEDAKLAWGKDDKAWKASGWGKNPADMCVARASAKLARLVYADVVFNLNAPEEIEER